MGWYALAMCFAIFRGQSPERFKPKKPKKTISQAVPDDQLQKASRKPKKTKKHKTTNLSGLFWARLAGRVLRDCFFSCFLGCLGFLDAFWSWSAGTARRLLRYCFFRCFRFSRCFLKVVHQALKTIAKWLINMEVFVGKHREYQHFENTGQKWPLV